MIENADNPDNFPGPERKAGILARTEAFVRARLEANACGHDFHHIHRVRVMALRIAPEVGADPFLAEMGALLHDIADPKLNDTPESGLRVLEAFLDGCGLPASFRAGLEDLLERVSFGKELDGKVAPKSPELQAVQDADRIDALGAI